MSDSKASVLRPDTPAITPERLSTLKRLCLARCGGDRREAKLLYKSMRAKFAELKPATQDILLGAMEDGLGTLREMNLIARPAEKCASDSATEANRVLASIMLEQAGHRVSDVHTTSPSEQASESPACPAPDRLPTV